MTVRSANCLKAENIYNFDTEFLLNPVYISAQIEVLKMNLFTFIHQNGERFYEENKMFVRLLRDKLASRRIIYEYKLTLHQFHTLLEFVRKIYMDSRATASQATVCC